MSEFTPGQWEPHIYESGAFEIVSIHDRKFIIASRNGYQEWERQEESIANARLIASAPELLAALEDVLQSAIILSEEYMEAFSNWPDNKEIQGWEKSRWIKAILAKKKAIAVIKQARGEE